MTTYHAVEFDATDDRHALVIRSVPFSAPGEYEVRFIDKVFPFERSRDAYERLYSGVHSGKIIASLL